MRAISCCSGKFCWESGENLKTLSEKQKALLPDMTRELLTCLPDLDRKAVPQGEGSYWPFLEEQDYPLSKETAADEADRILRAFFGYECIYMEGEKKWGLLEGVFTAEKQSVQCFRCREAGYARRKSGGFRERRELGGEKRVERKQENYFTAKMMRRQLVPSLISALGLAFGDIVDALVVGRQMGVTGLAAISLTLPVFMVINVVMHGFGIGALCATQCFWQKGRRKKRWGRISGDSSDCRTARDRACAGRESFSSADSLFLGTVPEDGIFYEAAGTYAGIILGGIPLFFLAYISNYYLRNDDCQRLAGVGFTIGNLSDIGLNFLLVWGLDLGVAGAAWATLAG